MAPKKQAKASESQEKSNMSRSDSTSVDASQDLETTKIQDMVNKHNQRCKERRRERKGVIVSTYKTQVEQLHSEIKQCLQSHEEKVRAIRRPKVEHLLQLVRKKRALQDRVQKCQSDLEQAFLSTARQLQVALDGRLEELSG